MTRSGVVIIASTRASAGVYDDRCGPVLVDWLNDRGIDTPAPVVVADGEPVDQALRAALRDHPDLILT
ncbi:MAG: molybdopterin-binding protein, partial [Mycolicibacterium sp.]